MQVKLIAAAAGIFGAGALLGWAATADYYDNKAVATERYTEYLREILYDRKQEVRELQEALVELESSVPTVPFNAMTYADILEAESLDEDGLVEDDEDEEEEYSEEKTEELRSNLQALIDNYTKAPKDVENFIEHSVKMDRPSKPPFVISRSKYAWDDEEGDYYDKQTLTWYPESRVVLDDDEEVVDDVASVLGWANLNRFGDESEDADTVFIRNQGMMTDFEVVRDYESPLPLHVKYGMGKEEFAVNKAAGNLRLPKEDL